MPTECLFREDSYLKSCDARVVAVTEQGGIVLDRTVFYATSGGQPGDTGSLTFADGTRIPVETAIYTDAAKTEIAHVLAVGASALKDRRQRHRRDRLGQALRPHAHAHGAACYSLRCCPMPVTGGSVGDSESRLDFDIPEAGLDKDAITAKVAEMVATNAAGQQSVDHRCRTRSQSGLVKTMSVKPPTGTGRVRLIEIAGLDLQPCGGTHVRATGEIGAVRVTQIEKKGKQNRRVRLALA